MSSNHSRMPIGNLLDKVWYYIVLIAFLDLVDIVDLHSWVIVEYLFFWF